MGVAMPHSPSARTACAIAVSAALVAARAWGDAAEPARGADPSPSALIGAPPLDDALPGPWIRRGPRRPASAPERTACSFRHPACVRAAAAAPPARVLAALASIDRAWDAATGPLSLPPPDASFATGTYDVYLVERPLADTLPGSTTVLDERDVRGGFDRASAYSLVDRRVSPGCALDTAIARELARAILFRVAPATDEGSARAETAYLTRLMVPCAMGDADGIDAFQARPDRAIADAMPGDDPAAATLYGRGAGLFYWWLDDAFGAAPGSMVRAIWALTPSRTPYGAARFKNEPDGYDVLRFTFKNALTTGSTVDDLLLDFAAARLFVGASADDAHLPESRALGDAARVRLDWDIAWPERPRTLAPLAPIAPTGSSYIRVSRRGAPKGSRLRVEASWEEHAKMRWAVVKLDAAGHEKGRIAIASPERATEAQGTIADLDDADTVVVVGVATGDFTYPFDPDDEIWEPHGWLVTLASE